MAKTIAGLRLTYVMIDRDDVRDNGEDDFIDCSARRALSPNTKIEVVAQTSALSRPMPSPSSPTVCRA